MNIKKRIIDFFENKNVLMRLVTTVLVLLVIWLISLTNPLWSWVFIKLKQIFLPFLFGFLLAYMIYPIVKHFEKYNIKRGITTVIIVIILFVGIGWLISSIIPRFSEDLRQFALSIVDSVQKLYDLYISKSDEPSQIVNSLYQEAVKVINSFALDLPNVLTGFVSSVVNFFTKSLFSLFIGIYFIFDYERFTSFIGSSAKKVSEKLYLSLKVVDSSLKMYLVSMLILMAIRFVEYSLIYFLVGHKYALILGILSAIALIVPYIGGTLMNMVGILTSLNLGASKLTILVIVLVVLSQVDGYVISPMVYSKRNKADPLIALFSLFACSAILGVPGVFLAMPIYFSVDGIIKLKKNDWKPI